MPAHFPSAVSVEKYITHDFPKASLTEKIADLKERISARPSFYDKFDFMYFVDHRNQLVGVISIIKLLELPDEVDLARFIHADVKRATTSDTIEEVIHKALHFGLTIIPVVDKAGSLIGIVSPKTLLKMEALLLASRGYRHAGLVHKDNLYELAVNGSVLELVQARVPWLLFGAVGGLIAAQYVGFFEATLEQNIILAFFIPTIVYMSGAVGTQTEILFIRTLAIAEKTKLFIYFLRDMVVASLLGVIIGGFLGGVVYLWKKDLPVALIIGLSMFLNFFVASPIALSIPVILKRFGKDPAIGSGPVATIIQDVISLIVYFLVATIVLKIT